MDWLVHDWDQQQKIAFIVGIAAGLTLVIMGHSGVAELGAMGAALGLRWGMWQIPPPGRSAAAGTPADGWERLAQLATAVLLVTLGLDLVISPLR